MSKLEERAGNFADNFTAYDSPVLANLIHHVVKDGYIKGATEQNEIDIERAWQWMRDHIKLIGCEMELHSQFVKAMKDE